MRSSVPLGALLACLAGSLVAPQSAPASWPGANGLLAFDTYDPGKQVRTRVVGTRRERVVVRFRPIPLGLQSHSGIPQWSPDGSRLLVQRIGSGFEIVRPNGRRMRLIKTSWLWPSWSPDGREIIAVDGDTTPYRLVRMRADGSRIRHIRIPPEAGVAVPRWSPDGRWILYEESREEGDFITRIRPDGTGLRRLVRGIGRYSWSPDGRRFAYAAGRQIWSMRPDGSGRRLLSRGRDNTTVVSIAWSPDGRRIALVRQTPADAHDSSLVATISATGGRERRLFGGERLIGPIDWQPR